MSGLTFAFYIGDGTWRDTVVRMATNAMESHVEFVVGDLAEANFCISASKRDGNQVRAKKITWKPDHWVFFEYPGHPELMFTRLEAQIGKPYDALGAVLSVTPFSRHVQGHWFCSELLAYAAELPGAPHRYTPGRMRRFFMDMGIRPIFL